MVEKINKIKIKISVTLFVILAICVTITFYFGSKIAVNYYHKEILKNLDAKSRIILLSINGDKYEKLINSDEKDGDPEYNLMLDPLKKIHKILPEVRYMYTTYIKDNKVFFGLDTAPKKDTDTDGIIDHSEFRSEYNSAPLLLKLTFKNNKAYITNEPYSDQWGSFIGVFRPIINTNGKIIGVLCIEMLYDEYQYKINMLKIINWILYFIAMIIVIGISYYINIMEKKYLQQFTKDLVHKKEMEHKDKTLYQESRMAEIGKIIAEIAHEINNPLMIIGSSAQSAQKAIYQLNVEFSHEKNYLRIEKSVKRISSIITNIKTLVKDGTQDPKVRIALIDVVSESFEMINFRLHNINIDIEIDANIMVEIQKIPLQQVFINLISNSCDALIDSENPWIKISAVKDGSHVIIDVEDSGLGIPDNVLKNIEVGYFSTKKTGTGLGLLICKKILDANNGVLFYKKKVNTCFRLLLPIVD